MGGSPTEMAQHLSGLLGGSAQQFGQQVLQSPNIGLSGVDSQMQGLQHFKDAVPFATGGPYLTQLTSNEQPKYEAWLNSIGRGTDSGYGPYSGPNAIYDMPGYWRDVASQGQNRTAVNPADEKLHFPDTYKTPYEPGFSAESKYATKDNPYKWYGETLIDERTGQRISGQPISTIAQYHAQGSGKSWEEYQQLINGNR